MLRKAWVRTLVLVLVGLFVGAQGVSTAELVFRVERVTGDLWARGWIETSTGFKFPDGSVQLSAANGVGVAWGLAGNSGTDPATHFLGTTDDVAFEIRVNDVRALRVEPNAMSPNIIGGYHGNTVGVGIRGATISGGGESDHINRVTGNFGTVGGGWSNTASNWSATVAGGYLNTASDYAATVSGGGENTATAIYATVGGGRENEASREGATVGGGVGNTANNYFDTVTGGYGNIASGTRSTVSGGHGNEASGMRSTISGGYGNTASGLYSTVTGGYDNTASGVGATVAGGYQNTAAGDYSFVIGRFVENDHVDHDSVFMFADSSTTDSFHSAAANEFAVRASGGYRLYSNATLTAGVTMAAGASGWSNNCDRELKENLIEVDGREILHKLSLIPIAEWNYKAQDEEIRHMGPMAQDFYAAFGLGESDLHISTVDVDGIALVSIQALYELSQEKDAQIAQQAEEIAKLTAENEEFRARLEALEKLVQ